MSTGRCTFNSFSFSKDACFRGGLREGLASSVSGPDSGCGAPGRQGERQVVVNVCGFCQSPLFWRDPSLPRLHHMVWVELCPFLNSRDGHGAEAWLTRAPHCLSHSAWVQGEHITQSGNSSTFARAFRGTAFLLELIGRRLAWHCRRPSLPPHGDNLLERIG